MYSSTLLISGIGHLSLYTDDLALYRISFPGCVASNISADIRPAPDDHPLLCRVKAQLSAYFQGKRTSFDLPLHPQGTAFQQAVWKCMREIPCGETRTYGELAEELGNRNKARAVGGAANKNPLPIVIPCHRVVGGSGSLTGFSGGLEVKRFLLDLESSLNKTSGPSRAATDSAAAANTASSETGRHA